jgi:hypothetical protein
MATAAPGPRPHPFAVMRLLGDAERAKLDADRREVSQRRRAGVVDVAFSKNEQAWARARAAAGKRQDAECYAYISETELLRDWLFFLASWKKQLLGASRSDYTEDLRAMVAAAEGA